MTDLRELVRAVPDFPKPGILFRDITPILQDPEAFEATVEALAGLAKLVGVTHIAGVESRGFIFGAPMATLLGVPFVLIRKPGKLPAATAQVEYSLEYGTDALEMHLDAVAPGDRVVVVDDLLATGGTAAAACSLIEGQGASVVSVLVVIELLALGGAEKLAPHTIHALLKY